MAKLKYFIGLIFIILSIGCSTNSIMTKNNGYSIKNYSDKIQYIELRDGRKIEFNTFLEAVK